MFKSFIFGFLVASILSGATWFFAGRNNIGEIRSDLNRVNGDFQDLQRISDKLSTDSSGFTGDIADIAETSRRIEDRAGRIEEGFTELDSGLGLSITKVDDLERNNKQLIRIGRDIGDLAFDLRRISKESGEEE